MRFGSRICWERECDLLYRQQTRCYLWSEVLFCFVMRAGWIAQMKSSCIGLVPYTILVFICLFIYLLSGFYFGVTPVMMQFKADNEF